MILLEPELTYRVHARGSLEPTLGASEPPQQFWHLVEGTLEGPRVHAKLASAGSDWMSVGPDRFWRPDVRMQFSTAEGAVILMSYTGLVEQTAAFQDAAKHDRETRWEDQYLRIAPRFETSDERYRWLTQHLFVGTGRLLGTGRMEYEIFRVA